MYRLNRICATVALCSAALLATRAQDKPAETNPAPGASANTDTKNGGPTDAQDKVDQVLQVGGSLVPPVAIHMANPKYSKEAREAKFSGQVVVSIIVGTDGEPHNVHILRGVGMGLDEEAMKAVKQYKFKPAMQNGKPVAVYVNVQVNFQIRSQRDTWSSDDN